MKILVNSLAGIGDTLIATPLIRELRRQFPQARLEAFVFYKASRELLEGNANVDAVHHLNLVHAGIPASLQFISTLRKNRYDISINTHPQSRIWYRVIARLID